MAVTWKKIAYYDDVIAKSTLSAKGSLISASAAGTPAELAVGTDAYVLVCDSGEATGLKWAAGATPAAHATSHKNGGSDELLLHELGEPTSAVDFDLQQATDLVVMTVANEAALPSSGIAVGQICFATSELTFHICTATS